MIIQLTHDIQPIERTRIDECLKGLGIPYYDVNTQMGNYLVCTPNEDVDIRRIGRLPGVRDVHRVSGPHKMVSSNWKVGRSSIRIGDQHIGNGSFTVMAGPCSIESEKQVLHTVRKLKEQGVRIMRGGVYKPRTSPYNFRGLGLDGLKMFSAICQDHDIKIITEVMEAGQIEGMMPYL